MRDLFQGRASRIKRQTSLKLARKYVLTKRREAEEKRIRQQWREESEKAATELLAREHSYRETPTVDSAYLPAYILASYSCMYLVADWPNLALHGPQLSHHNVGIVCSSMTANNGQVNHACLIKGLHAYVHHQREQEMS